MEKDTFFNEQAQRSYTTFDNISKTWRGVDNEYAKQLCKEAMEIDNEYAKNSCKKWGLKDMYDYIEKDGVTQ